MPISAKETILEALKELLIAAFAVAEAPQGVSVERNTELPEEIARKGSLIILRDGDPGEPEQCIGFANSYYQHAVPIEIYVQDDKADLRDERYDQILRLIGQALEADEKLGGLIFGMTYGQPNPLLEVVEGAGDIKSCEMIITLDYETATPLG